MALISSLHRVGVPTIVVSVVVSAGVAMVIPSPGRAADSRSMVFPEADTGFGSPLAEDPPKTRGGYSFKQLVPNPKCGGMRLHPGIDLNGPPDQRDGSPQDDDEDDSVFAAANGLVVWTAPDDDRDGVPDNWGGVVIRHRYRGATFYSEYGHVDKILVRVGQTVSKGQVIAEIGAIHPATAPHLHFEIRTSELKHPNPVRGNYWDCDGFKKANEAAFDTWYRPPLKFLSEHGPYQVTVAPADESVPIPAGLPNPSAASLGCTVESRIGTSLVQPEAVYRRLREAALTPDDAEVLTAIAGAESSWHLDAWAKEPNCSVSYGVFQINSVHKLDLKCVFNLGCASRFAAWIFEKSGFSAWSTYGNGKYLRFLERAHAARETVESEAVSETLAGLLSANPSAGTAPLRGVELVALVSGTARGTVNYTFYCNRSDTGTNITAGWVAKFDGVFETAKTARDACTYETPGSYTAKVIVERGGRQAEARATIVVREAVAGNQAPVARLTICGIGGCAYEGQTLQLSPVQPGGSHSVSLSAERSSDLDGSIVSYRWQIDGSQVSSSQSFSYNDLGGGTHTVVLTVTDDRGATASASATVVVPEEAASELAPPTDLGVGYTPGPPKTYSLFWTASPDSRVVAYQVLQGNTVIATTSSTSYTLGSLACDTVYTHSVRGVDGSGNVSSSAWNTWMC